MDEPLWSNLEQAPSHPVKFDAFAPILERFGITLPIPLYEALLEAAEREAGPRHPLSNLFG